MPTSDNSKANPKGRKEGTATGVPLGSNTAQDTCRNTDSRCKEQEGEVQSGAQSIGSICLKPKCKECASGDRCWRYAEEAFYERENQTVCR